MDRRVVWTADAQISRRLIFDYWNNSNKSKGYSKKLNTMFFAALQLVSKLPDIGKPTDIDNINLITVSHFQIGYYVTNKAIIVLKLWDTRQNPNNSPLK